MTLGKMENIQWNVCNPISVKRVLFVGATIVMDVFSKQDQQLVC